MRDIAVTLLVLAGFVYTLKKPYVGILLWSWLGYMNPHRLCFGFAFSMPFAQITAILTMGAMLFSKEKKELPKDAIVYLFFIFLVWLGLSTFFAFEEDLAQQRYTKFIKIMLPILLTMMMFKSKERINQLIWVIVFSLGFFAVKGGVFTLLTAGAYRVYGPPDSFVEENNSLAVASLMIMPLMLYLRTQLTEQWQKTAMLLCILSMSFSVIGSQSRGAFVAILIVGLYFWLQSERKFISSIMIVFFIALLAAFLPESWYERMDTISNYDTDQSAMGRVRAWIMAFNVANSNLFGGGFDLWNQSSYIRYLDGFIPGRKAYVAHSIYFSVLGEHGWGGLLLFLSMFALGWRKCSVLVKQCNHKEHVQWIADLAKMMKVGLLAYFAGGAFLSLSYFDLPWHFLAIIVLLKEISDKLNLEENVAEVSDLTGQAKTSVSLSSSGLLK